MIDNIPIAAVNGQRLPRGAIPPYHPPQGAPLPDAVPGAAQPVVAPAAQPDRNPIGPIAPHAGSSTQFLSPLLKLSAAHPMSTSTNKRLNTFVPDATMLFHVLSICDASIIKVDRFHKCCDYWLPIVSQLYVSVLWNFMILSIQQNSSKPGPATRALSEVYKITNLQDCLIPGPLVPFFQALGSFQGPYTWMGNICPNLPEFRNLWNATGFHVNPDFARLVPIPAVLLDQLHYFATHVQAGELLSIANFRWYANIFQQALGTHNRLNRMGPQLAGSLHAPTEILTPARAHWSTVFTADMPRTNAAQAPALRSYFQLFGFRSQNGTIQSDWFTHVSEAMQKYCLFFNGSVPLRDIPLTGNGNVAVYATPTPSPEYRNWLYPTDANIAPFLVSRSTALRALPPIYEVEFNNAHNGTDLSSEQYAILTQVNIKQPQPAIETQNEWVAINPASIHTGEYWIMPSHRTSRPINTVARYSRTINNRFVQINANRAS